MQKFTFDPNQKPSNDGLNDEMAAMRDRVFYSRRPKGMNVQFIREDGARDEWSFNSVERAEGFAASIIRQGRPAVISK